ncbi:Rhodanese- sulfurtransferase [Rhizophlyctis rosea]|uniref:Ribosome biogenesis regulatory protein n=1 Tax=Rhizophlyctis rosea TaxID=64517 RepID=A0AAD5SK11_9FUNG|nr:Rhodanese- sulfurtransferase [Rhizophlyctis rosea]
MDVTEQLQALKDKYKSVEVEVPVPFEFDLGNLTAFDSNGLDERRIKNETNNYLKDLARDGTQLLLNQIFALPTKSSTDGVFAELPEPTTVLPRAKPLPKPKLQTRWEKFAKAKGIQKRKKGRMVYDEQADDYKPRWGYNRANDNQDDWIIEVPDTADPMEDQYEKRRDEKKERVEKNKKQARRNLEERSAVEAGKNPKEVRKAQLEKAIVESKTSTASLGRFDKKLQNEDVVKIKRSKRKFEATTIDASKEAESAMNIAKKVLKAGDSKVINVSKAVKQVAGQASAEMLGHKGKKRKSK